MKRFRVYVWAEKDKEEVAGRDESVNAWRVYEEEIKPVQGNGVTRQWTHSSKTTPGGNPFAASVNSVFTSYKSVHGPASGSNGSWSIDTCNDLQEQEGRTACMHGG